MVNAASLQNLIPMPSKWGVATQAIRIPAELVEDIFEMVNQRMQALKNAVLANPKNEWIEVPADQEDIEEMLAEEPNPVYEQAVAEFQAKVAATPEGQAHLAKVEEIKAQWQKLGLLDEEPTSNDALISAIQQQPQAEENINDWLFKQPGYEVETYVLDEESGELLEQQQQPQKQSTLAAKQSKQQAKRDRRLNQAKKSGALSGKGFAPKQKLVTGSGRPDELNGKAFYKAVSALFQKESRIAEENLKVFMREVMLTCSAGKFKIFEDILNHLHHFLVVDLTLKGTMCSAETWRSYNAYRLDAHERISEKVKPSPKPGGINDRFLQLIAEALDCWQNCSDNISCDEAEKNLEYLIENNLI
jgi:hypothetical protein